jgi:CcmD family protein
MTAHDEGRDQGTPPGQDAPQTPSDRATTFRAVSGEPEHYSGEKLLVGAYAIVWIVVFAWVAGVWRKQRSMTQRLDALEGEIARAAATRAKADGAHGAP